MPFKVTNLKYGLLNQLRVNQRSSAPVLRRIAQLLTGILIALLVGFCFFASSLFITLLLAAFFSILVAPIVSILEKVRLPRSLAVGIVILTGTVGVGYALFVSYGQLSAFSDDLPEYADKVREAISPLSDKIQQVQESARTINPETPSKKIPEVRIHESISWTSYLVRGVGSLWGALIVAGVIPFLMFFMLIARDKLTYCVEVMFGRKTDVEQFLKRMNRMIRTYVVGNLLIAAVLAGISTLVFWSLGLKAPWVLGTASGFLNVIPFFGAVLALALPILSALLQFHTIAPFLIIGATVLVLHLVSANFLIPRLIGPQVDIGPVAATIGILFWSWLWGIPGLLLAIPLTAFVKMVADASPSLHHLSNFLAHDPQQYKLSEPESKPQETSIASEASP